MEITRCPSGPDSVWGIIWPETERNNVSAQMCPGQFGSESVTGQATRYCDNDGIWSEPDVLGCQDMEFTDILDQASVLTQAVNVTASELVEQTTEITMQLAVITEPDTVSLLPSSLNATNEVVTNILDVLEEAENNTVEANELVVNVINNILDQNNTQGWMALQLNNAGSQVLLNNAERLGILLAQTQNSSNTSSDPVRVSRPNIAISAKQYDTTEEVDSEDLTFPQEEDLVNYDTESSLVTPANVQIPVELLRERLNQTNDTAIPIVFILFQNLAAFLPASARNINNNTRGVSVVISSQVGETVGPSRILQDSPISLNFTFGIDQSEDILQYRCVFWNFSQPVGNGGWINDGVSTVGNTTVEGTTTVECASTHLTSFAVLVDVAGALRNNSSADEARALQVVSYIGCTVSIISLTITVLFFLLHGKKLLTQVHYFVHLNLALSLLLAYLVFVVGIETATGSVGGCAFVAALLHYLFLAAFSWMLCEGVMLYLMLVVVFSKVAKSWWFFLLLGYLLPLPFVIITLIVRWEYYGVKDQSGNLQFCWLSTEHGTIFGFVVPMLMIIIINIVFLGFVLKALWKNKKSTLRRSLSFKENNTHHTFELAKSLLLAVVVLLPLLGLTWVFGLLTVNSNTTVFAWIFTFLNSLQGVAILFFHVVRSEKVKEKLGQLQCQFCTKRRGKNILLRKLETGDTGMDTLKSTLDRRISTDSSYSDIHINTAKKQREGFQFPSSLLPTQFEEDNFMNESEVIANESASPSDEIHTNMLIVKNESDVVANKGVSLSDEVLGERINSANVSSSNYTTRNSFKILLVQPPEATSNSTTFRILWKHPLEASTEKDKASA